jgi:hypothetical protein
VCDSGVGKLTCCNVISLWGWTYICTAIETVNRTYIRDGVRKHQEQEAEIESLGTQLNCMERTLAQSNNPVSNITMQLSRTSISNAQSAPSTLSPHQFPQQPNPSHQTRPSMSSVTTEDEKTIVQVNIMKYMHHPSTAKGHTAYFKQMCT